MGDGDTIDTAFTDTGEVISDAQDAQENTEMRITAATPAITINGTPALGDLINLKLSRNVGGTDNLGTDAWLFGCFLQLTRNEAVSGW
jgi:hypothetical protein